MKKALNKMLDKVCGKSKRDDEEDVATILRKPIDFTKSGLFGSAMRVIWLVEKYIHGVCL